MSSIGEHTFVLLFTDVGNICHYAIMPLCHFVMMTLCYYPRHYALMPLCHYAIMSLCPHAIMT